MTIRVRVEATAGDDLASVADEMIALRNQLHCGIVCNFNGIDLNVWSHTKEREEVIKSYHSSIKFRREVEKTHEGR